MVFFSIVIPTYKRLAQLSNTLQLLQAQTYRHFEIVIVEDIYNNAPEIATFTGVLSIQYQYLEHKKPVSEKRNIGAALAKGNYLIFLDDDDAVTNTWLYDFAAALEHDNTDIAFCAVAINHPKKPQKIMYPQAAYTDERGWGIFLAGAFAVKKSLFEQVGKYDPILRYGENTELGIRLKQAISSHCFINRVNLTYTAAASGGSKNIENTFVANIHIINKHKHWFEERPILYHNYLSVLGVISCKLNKPVLAKAYFKDALHLNWFNLRAWQRYFLTLFPVVAKKVWHI